MKSPKLPRKRTLTGYGSISQNHTETRKEMTMTASGGFFFITSSGLTVSVFVRSVDTEIKENTAIVRANVILVRGKDIKSISDIIPESAAGYRFEMVFKKEGRDWKVVSGTWQDVGAAGLL